MQRIVRQTASEVAELDRVALSALIPVLRDARAELREDLLTWLNQIRDGGERFTAQHYRSALRHIEGAIDVLGELRPATYRALRAVGDAAGQLALKHLEFHLARFSEVFGLSLRPPQLRQAAVLARGNKLLIPRFRTSAARYATNVRADITHQFGVGLARGETFDQLTDRLQRLGGPRGLVALRGVAGEPGAIVEHIAEGLFRRYRYWGERLVRTEVIHAYNLQHHAGIDQLNKERDPDERPFSKRWDASLDSRVCVICRQLDGEVVKADKEFTGGHKHPPAHPNCRCTVLAWDPEWDGDSAAEKRKSDRKTKPPAAAAPPSYIGAARDGDWAAARDVLEKDFARRGYYLKNARTRGVHVREQLPDAVLGQYKWDGAVEVTKATARGAKQFALAWASNAGRVQRELADFDREWAQARKQNRPAAATAGYQTAQHLHDYGVLAHEVLHGFGPTRQDGYQNAGALVEEVTTELATRLYLRRQFRVPKRLSRTWGAYQAEIDGLVAAVADVHGVSHAKAAYMVERAAEGLKKQSIGSGEVVTRFVRLLPGKGDPVEDRPSRDLSTDSEPLTPRQYRLENRIQDLVHTIKGARYVR